MVACAAILILCLFVWTPGVFSQTAETSKTGSASAEQQCPGKIDCESHANTGTGKKGQSKESKPDQSSQKRQTNRIMWVVPNFAAVSAGKQLPPLTVRGKFELATRDCLDYSGFTWTAILAAQTYASNSDPELGRGAAAYGRYFWRTFADGVSGSYFTEAIVPSLTHQDPRYYTLGQGSFWKRSEYALSRVVITKTDSGGTSFNWSEVGGNALVAGLSNAYYPPQERGLHQTVRDWGAQIESAALNNLVKEFWPDIRHKILRQK